MKLCTMFILPEEVPTPHVGEQIDLNQWRNVGVCWVRDDHTFGLKKDRRLFHLEGKVEKVKTK